LSGRKAGAKTRVQQYASVSYCAVVDGPYITAELLKAQRLAAGHWVLAIHYSNKTVRSQRRDLKRARWPLNVRPFVDDRNIGFARDDSTHAVLRDMLCKAKRQLWMQLTQHAECGRDDTRSERTKCRQPDFADNSIRSAG